MGQLNRVLNSSLLDSSYELQNQFQSTFETSGSKAHKNTITYIKKLFKRYINARSKSQKSDQYVINHELLKNFRDDFYRFINNLSTNIGSMLDLDLIIEELYKTENINKDFVTEIVKISSDVLRRILRAKINKKIDDAVSTLDLKKILTKIEPYDLSETDTQRLIDNSLIDTHPLISSMTSEFGQATDIYRNSLFRLFNRHLVHDANRRRYLEQIEGRKKSNNVIDNIGLNLFKKLDNIVNKKADNLCNSLIFILGNSFLKRTYEVTKKFISFVVKLPVKIIKTTIKFTKMIANFIQGLLKKVISNLVLKPIHFIVSTTSKMVKKTFNLLSKFSNILTTITKKVFFKVKELFSKVKLQFILLSPPGMYALGFLIGFIWQKIKNVLPQGEFSMVGIIELIKNFVHGVVENYKNVVDAMVDGIDRVIYPIQKQIDNNYYLRNLKYEIINFKDEINNKGLIGAIKNTPMYKFLSNNFIWQTLTTLYKVGEKFISWIGEHPTISAFLFSAAEGLKYSSLIKNLIKNVKIPITGGSIFNLLIGLVAGHTTYTVAEGVKSMFGSSDMKTASWKFARHKEELMQVMSYNMEDKKSIIFNEKTAAKYEILTQYIQNKTGEILQLNRHLELLNDLVEHTEYGQNISNLMTEAPLYIRTVLRLGKYNIQNFEKLTVNEQFKTLQDILTNETRNIKLYQNLINKTNQSSIDSVMNDLVDDSGIVKSLSTDNKVVSSIIEVLERGSVALDGDKSMTEVYKFMVDSVKVYNKASNIDKKLIEQAFSESYSSTKNKNGLFTSRPLLYVAMDEFITKHFYRGMYHPSNQYSLQIQNMFSNPNTSFPMLQLVSKNKLVSKLQSEENITALNAIFSSQDKIITPLQKQQMIGEILNKGTFEQLKELEQLINDYIKNPNLNKKDIDIIEFYKKIFGNFKKENESIILNYIETSCSETTKLITKGMEFINKCKELIQAKNIGHYLDELCDLEKKLSNNNNFILQCQRELTIMNDNE